MFYFDIFVIALNAAFTQQLSSVDEGYESGSNTDLPTPLQKTPHIHHVSSMEHASFNPAHITPCHPAYMPDYNTQLTLPRPVCCHLMFISDSSERDQAPDSSSDNDQDLDSSSDSSSDEEEDFPTGTYR